MADILTIFLPQTDRHKVQLVNMINIHVPTTHPNVGNVFYILLCKDSMQRELNSACDFVYNKTSKITNWPIDSINPNQNRNINYNASLI